MITVRINKEVLDIYLTPSQQVSGHIAIFLSLETLSDLWLGLEKTKWKSQQLNALQQKIKTFTLKISKVHNVICPNTIFFAFAPQNNRSVALAASEDPI